jgi:hypothetical protein
VEEEFAMKNDASDTYSSPTVEMCLDAVLRELDSDARFDLLDSRLQLAVVPISLGTNPAWAYVLMISGWKQEHLSLPCVDRIQVSLLTRRECTADRRNGSGLPNKHSA